MTKKKYHWQISYIPTPNNSTPDNSAQKTITDATEFKSVKKAVKEARKFAFQNMKPETEVTINSIDEEGKLDHNKQNISQVYIIKEKPAHGLSSGSV